MRIRNVIHLFSTVWLLILLLTVNAAIYFLFANVTINSELERVTQRAEEIVRNVQPRMEEAERSAMLRAFLPADGMIRIVNEDQTALVTIAKNTELANRTVTHHPSQVFARQDEFAVAYYPIIWENGDVVTLEVIASLEPVLSNLNLLKIVLTIATLLVLVLSFFSGRLLSVIILRPINSMIDTMEEIQRKGIFKKLSMKQRPNDELYKLGNTFNHMIERLEQNFNKQQQFVSDASHELKTPLTIIDSYASMLKRWGMQRPDLLNESIDAIHSEAARMKEMTEQLLLLAKNEEDWNMSMTTFNLKAFCEEASRTFQNVYERDIFVQQREGKVPFVYADEQKIKQVLFILLDNALKYSQKPIDILVGREQESCYFIVKDYGIGISKKDQKGVFDRFYRVDEARTREQGGTGLGLAIAKKIVDAHNGSIHIESEENEGTEVKISLPCVNET